MVIDFSRKVLTIAHLDFGMVNVLLVSEKPHMHMFHMILNYSSSHIFTRFLEFVPHCDMRNCVFLTASQAASSDIANAP